MSKSTHHDLLVIYDGNCRFCRSMAAFARRISLIPENRLLDYFELDENNLKIIDAERFREEMAVIHRKSQKVSYGIQGILLALSYRLPFLHPEKIQPGFILNFIYRLIALNRYVIMPPPAGIRCECEPELHKDFRSAYLIICILVAVAFQSIFFKLAFQNVDSYSLLVIVTGWIIPLLFVRLFNGSLRFYEYMGHLGSVAIVSSAVLIPASLLQIADISPSLIYLSGILLGGWLHYRRMQRMNYQAATFIFSISAIFIYIILGVFL